MRWSWDWKPTFGWRTTAIFIIGGAFEVVTDDGFRWSGAALPLPPGS